MTTSAMRPSVASMLMLTAWLGAAIFFVTVITPAAFEILPTRSLAGALVGRGLPVLFVTGALVGLAVAYLSRAGVSRAVIRNAAAVFAVASAAALLVSFRLKRNLEALGTPIDALALTDPRRISFGRMHGVSVLLMGIGTVAAFTALVVLWRQLDAASRVER